jgi:hypothetical protein
VTAARARCSPNICFQNDTYVLNGLEVKFHWIEHGTFVFNFLIYHDSIFWSGDQHKLHNPCLIMPSQGLSILQAYQHQRHVRRPSRLLAAETARASWTMA